MARRHRQPRSRRRFAMRGRRRRFFRDRRLPLLPLLGGVVAPMWDSANKGGVIDSSGNVNLNMNTAKGFIDQIGQHYMGISVFPELSGLHTWSATQMVPTYTGLIAGVIGSKIATMLGVNKQMRRIPFVGRYIKL